MLLASNIAFFFFFFQAEDGIRDHCVTGVQTCALPICGSRRRAPSRSPRRSTRTSTESGRRMRELKYREAIDEATRQAMAKDERVFVLGVGVDDAKGIFGTTRGATLEFGPNRVFDTPLSEAALSGVAR